MKNEKVLTELRKDVEYYEQYIIDFFDGKMFGHHKKDLIKNVDKLMIARNRLSIVEEVLKE